ncbi:MAG TPA: penicillin-binding transpeptidase domain-containing protein [Myxococcales bacterium]|jgi:membrane peptidoglycan carboxypeptidase
MPRWVRCAVAALVGALGLVALGAAGSASEISPGPDAAAAAPAGPDAGVLQDAQASSGSAPAPLPAAEEPEAEAAAAEPNGAEGEGQVADFPVPQFSSLAPIAKDVDFLAQAVLRDGKLVVDPPPSATAEQSVPVRTLTVDPRYQKELTALLKSYAVPYGAIAAVEPASGRVLALAEYSHDAPQMRGLPLKAVYPAASVFKIVTGSALLEAGVSTEESVCFHGGMHRLSPSLLQDSKRDYRCDTLAQALGHSLNVVFAKLADRKLDGKALRAAADKFGFNAPLSFDEPVDVSVARIPESGFDFAKTAAGFGEVFLSPLHGALLAASIGNGGVMMSPVLFEGQKSEPKRVLGAATAKAVGEMCELTVSEGTARRAFRERGRPALGQVKAAGKTGSLHDKKPFRDFTWFVGWAPKDHPTVAVAAVVVNGPMWRVHAPYLGREALRMYLEPPPAPKAKAAKQTTRSKRTASRGSRYAAR